MEGILRFKNGLRLTIKTAQENSPKHLKTANRNSPCMGLYTGVLIVGRMFAGKIGAGGLISGGLTFWGPYYRNFTVYYYYYYSQQPRTVSEGFLVPDLAKVDRV